MSLKVKKGQNVIMKGFTGIKLGLFPVAEITETGIVILKKDGSKAIFSKKTGKQTNAAHSKYANSIIEDDGSYVAPSHEGRKKKTSTKKHASEEDAEDSEDEDEDEDTEDSEDADDDDTEDEEDEKPVKKSKPAKKSKKSKKSKKAEDDEYEEVE